MSRRQQWWLSSLALLPAASQGSCVAREVPEDIYAEHLTYAAAASTSTGPESSPTSVDEAGVPTPLSMDPPNPECDLSGRWLVSERRVATGLGVQQAGVYWIYLDLQQGGDDIVVRKGLTCGTEVQPMGALSATVDMSGCWPSLMADNPLDGWTARVTDSESGCQLEFDRYYAVFGATADHYRDPSVPMPTLDERASDGSPGWEDCDQDGSPGVTLRVSGIVSGTRSESVRTWGEYAGTIPKGASNFQVPLDWGQDEAVLAVSSEVMKATGAKDGNSALHFAQFARLSDDQAAGGTDEAICQEIRRLAPQLTPEATK